MAQCRTEPRRILLVDDNLEFVRALELFLSPYSRFAVIGRALSGPEAVELAVDLRPDIALIDYDMPVLNGVQTLRKMKRRVPTMRAVIVSGFAEYEHQFGGIDGADGFISKDRIEDGLVTLLDALAGGPSG